MTTEQVAELAERLRREHLATDEELTFDHVAARIRDGVESLLAGLLAEGWRPPVDLELDATSWTVRKLRFAAATFAGTFVLANPATELPDWFRTAALGYDMRPIAEPVVRAVLEMLAEEGS